MISLSAAIFKDLFMKTSLTALAAILALTISGCGPALVPPSEKSVNNGSGAKMEQVSQSGFARLMFRDKSTPVNVPAKTVLKRLSAFAKQCIQARTVVIESVGGSGYGRGYSRTDLHFRAHVAQEDRIDRLLILGKQIQAIWLSVTKMDLMS